jgi:beta-galactosidase
VDMAGLPKNRFYGYKARWTDEDVLHIFPHWNWEGCEGQTVPVHVYASYKYSAVELFINGVSQGKRTFDKTKEIERYRLIWNEVKYEPGEVKAVAYDADGNACNTAYVRTAGKPHHVELRADRHAFNADGEDLIYVTAAIVDENGTVCPKADNRVFFIAEGPAEILTTDAGDPRETESFARPDKKALAGMLVCCVRSVEGKKGQISILADAEGVLMGGEVVLKAE